MVPCSLQWDLAVSETNSPPHERSRCSRYAAVLPLRRRPRASPPSSLSPSRTRGEFVPGVPASSSRTRAHRRARGARDLASFSVGIDRVDLAKCREHGIRVTNTPDVLTD